jgi:hypothetical protein
MSYGMGVESSAILRRWIMSPATRRPCPLEDLIVITAQVGDEYTDTGRDVNTHILPLMGVLGMANESLSFISMLREKLADEIVARLSELAEPKIGRLTFHFATVKLEKFEDEVRAFSGFISREKLQEKRNSDISHKELPEQWDQHKHFHIPYRTMLKGIAMALRLMKTIDRIVIGPAAKYLWPEMRKRRYKLMNPAKAAYLMLPHLNLAPEVRRAVILEEMEEGRAVWSDMTTTINGKEVTVSACREWGAFLLGGRLIVLEPYPLQALDSIEVPVADEAAGC